MNDDARQVSIFLRLSGELKKKGYSTEVSSEYFMILKRGNLLSTSPSIDGYIGAAHVFIDFNVRKA